VIQDEFIDHGLAVSHAAMSQVDLQATPAVIVVWRSVRVGGDTKTRNSRPTLELPQRRVNALSPHRGRQDQLRERAGDRRHDNDLVAAATDRYSVGYSLPGSRQAAISLAVVQALAAAGRLAIKPESSMISSSPFRREERDE
jgi:hypothetical protein